LSQNNLNNFYFESQIIIKYKNIDTYVKPSKIILIFIIFGIGDFTLRSLKDHIGEMLLSKLRVGLREKQILR